MPTMTMTLMTAVAPRSVAKPRCAKVIRCAYKTPRGYPPKKPTRKAAVLDAIVSCDADKGRATRFNQCYFNFDNLDSIDAEECLFVADEILDAKDSDAICDDTICTDKDDVDWFKRYISNAFGL